MHTSRFGKNLRRYHTGKASTPAAYAASLQRARRRWRKMEELPMAKTASARPHDTREGWLIAATNAMRPIFAEAGYTIPADMRFAVAFPSAGMRGKAIGECWAPEASADGFHNIIIRADQATAADVLGVLVHENVHAAIGTKEGHGKTFRKAATKLGLTGKMRATEPGADLKRRLQTLAETLGSFPHAKLNWCDGGGSDRPKKQGTRMLKAQCACDGCGYTIRITRKWADVGLPECPAHAAHGVMVCDGVGE
jgi:hypothetical protein